MNQYTRQEQKIATADGGGIRQRWLYGLRLIRDPKRMSEGGGGLKHGATAALIEDARKLGIELSRREIQYRIRCGRTYPTESQMRNAVSHFATWHDLVAAGFPPFEPDEEGEPEADHRTDAERAAAAKAELRRQFGPNGGDPQLEIHLAQFPADRFDPKKSTLKDLLAHAEDMERMTAGYHETDKRRREYLNELLEAVDDDLSATWLAAHLAAFGTEEVDDIDGEPVRHDSDDDEGDRP